MKTAVAERLLVPEVKVDWEKIKTTAQEEQEKDKDDKQDQPKEEPKDPYWKDYNEFLVNLA